MIKIESKNTESFDSENLNEIKYLSTEFDNVKAQEINKQSIVFDGWGAEALPGAEVTTGRVVQELIGMLLIENKAVGIIRASKAGKTRFIITKIDPNGEKFTLIDVLKPDQPLLLGRDNIDPENKFISRKHAELTLSDDAELTVKDVSANGTVFIHGEKDKNDNAEKRAIISSLKRILGKDDPVKESVSIGSYIENPKNWGVFGHIPNLIFEDDNGSVNGDIMWDYTRIPTLDSSQGYAPKGYEEPYVNAKGERVPAYYLDRPVINRNSNINGGVYIVPSTQEAIVVDDGTRPKRGSEPKDMNPHYQRAFIEFIKGLSSRGIDIKHGVNNKKILKLLEAAHEVVAGIIKYDSDIAESAEIYFADRKINLDSFIANGKGVCRHQALLVGYLLERLINEGYAGGKVSVDRNIIKGRGGHAWARYTSDDGTVYVVDPAQGYVGSLSNSLNSSGWSYSRPDDKL